MRCSCPSSPLLLLSVVTTFHPKRAREDYPSPPFSLPLVAGGAYLRFTERLRRCTDPPRYRRDCHFLDCQRTTATGHATQHGMSRVGLVTTFRFGHFGDDEHGQASVERCWSTLASFLLFHLAKGVEHVFLYADADDNSNQVYVERVARDFRPSQVSVAVRDESQRQRQKEKCLLWNELGSFSTTEVPARQSLNAEEALGTAGEMGLDWLLHLDVDELFYTSEPSIKPHFEQLSDLGVEQMTYANHEAVPPHEGVMDYFSEVDLFRVNHLVLPLSRAVGESTRFWRRRTSHGQYMLAYDNGKAAVRVLPGRVVPQSVHRWRTLRPEEKLRLEGKGGEGASEAPELVNRSAMADPRELNFDQVLECGDPCVLHYTSCGLDWLRDKYRLLGNFPSSWFGGKLPIAPCFHLDARNAMVDDTASPNDDNSGAVGDEQDGSRELYHKEVMLCRQENAEEIRTQLEHGVLRVITGPASAIKQARQDAQRSLAFRGTPTAISTTVGLSQPCAQTEQESVRGGARAVSVAEAPTAPGSGMVTAASSVGAVLGAAGKGRLPTASLEGDAALGFENSWILAACARDFL